MAEALGVLPLRDFYPRQRLVRRHAGLVSERGAWLSHWREISDWTLPRRGRYLLGTKDTGGPLNRDIINNAARRAVSITAAGLMAGMTNPKARWFRLGTLDPAVGQRQGVRDWLDHVEDVIYRVFEEADLYGQLGNVYEDLLLYGTSVLWQEEDRDTVMRYTALSAGEYALGLDGKGQPGVLYRKWPMTAEMIGGRWGRDKPMLPVREAIAAGNYDQWFDVVQAVQAASPMTDDVPGAKRWPWVSLYWEEGRPFLDRNDDFLGVGGWNEKPFLAPRWDVGGCTDAYGRSPGMDALGDCKQIQTEEKRKAIAIDRVSGFGAMQGPSLPTKADFSAEAYNEVPPGKEQRITAIFEVPPQAVQVIQEDIGVLQARIRADFFADVFTAFLSENLASVPVDAIARKHEEQLTILGPMLNRMNRELLAGLVDGAYGALERHSMGGWRTSGPAPLPPPPQELQGQQLQIRYVSVLQQALERARLGGVQNVLQTAVALGQLIPAALDKVDADEMLDEVAEANGTPAKLLKSDEQVKEIRDARARAQQAQMQAAAVQAAAHAAPGVAKAATDLSAMAGHTGP